MKNKKGFKYYLRLYALIMSVYVIFTVIMAATNDWTFDPLQLASVVYLPIMFVVFLFLFDSIFGTIFKPKTLVRDEEFTAFAKKAANAMDEKENFTIEDFRRLQESDKFQKALRHAFDITIDGETEEMNTNYLEKKFKKDTIEGKALRIVLDEVKKMI